MSDGEPLACSLAAGEMAGREAELRSVFSRDRLIESARGRSGLRLLLRDSPGLEERVARLVELERACCPFLEVSVERDADRLRVLIEGPPEAGPVIDMFEELMAGRGVAVRPRGPG